ncbi:hypothetical protein RRG08_032361 [Elysia crispata]|uniref:Uncharacterized protein n=1 Tax=Elysia crispata TaxID=231223 RepID=A0AAE1AH38_9GAST|nr:hypothetical protein RRG08_032361 [Elysia crispata]
MLEKQRPVKGAPLDSRNQLLICSDMGMIRRNGLFAKKRPPGRPVLSRRDPTYSPRCQEIFINRSLSLQLNSARMVKSIDLKTCLDFG